MTLRLKPLPIAHFEAWREQSRVRLVRLRQESGLRPGAEATEHADAMLAQLLPDGAESAASTILVIVVDETEVGTVWLSLTEEHAFLVDVRAERDLTDSERDALIGAIESLARDNGNSTLGVRVFWQDLATRALVAGRGYFPSSIQMVLDPLPERGDVDERIVVKPMTSERFDLFAVESARGFAEALAGTGNVTREQADAEAQRAFERELPDGLASPGQLLFTANVDGEEVGVLWIAMRSRGAALHGFIFDVAVDAGHRRKGYGRAIMHAAERESRRLGASSIGLHVLGTNQGAASLYEQLGYRRLEELLIRQL